MMLEEGGKAPCGWQRRRSRCRPKAETPRSAVAGCRHLAHGRGRTAGVAARRTAPAAARRAPRRDQGGAVTCRRKRSPRASCAAAPAAALATRRQATAVRRRAVGSHRSPAAARCLPLQRRWPLLHRYDRRYGRRFGRRRRRGQPVPAGIHIPVVGVGAVVAKEEPRRVRRGVGVDGLHRPRHGWWLLVDGSTSYAAKGAGSVGVLCWREETFCSSTSCAGK